MEIDRISLFLLSIHIHSSKDKLQIWIGHSTLISENLKPVEISKNNSNIKITSSKVVLIFKIRRARLNF
jgi:hypothetical protein